MGFKEDLQEELGRINISIGKNKGFSIDLLDIVFIILLIVKLVGIAELTWLAVFTPLIVKFVLLIIAIILLAICLAFVAKDDEKSNDDVE